MSNAARAVWDHASADPDRIALRGAGEPWSYGHLRERAAAFAAQLAAQGVRPGDRVLLVCPSVPEFAAAYYGIHAAGAVAVTANTMSTRPELEYLGGELRGERGGALAQVPVAPRLPGAAERDAVGVGGSVVPDGLGGVRHASFLLALEAAFKFRYVRRGPLNPGGEP